MLSLWNYLRVRTHEAILAGVRDALEDVEQGDLGKHHLESSLQLLQKLSDATPRIDENGKAKQGEGATAASHKNNQTQHQSQNQAKELGKNPKNHQQVMAKRPS